MHQRGRRWPFVPAHLVQKLFIDSVAWGQRRRGLAQRGTDRSRNPRLFLRGGRSRSGSHRRGGGRGRQPRSRRRRRRRRQQPPGRRRPGRHRRRRQPAEDATSQRHCVSDGRTKKEEERAAKAGKRVQGGQGTVGRRRLPGDSPAVAVDNESPSQKETANFNSI